jgi:uncharacterized tellurite resistance protein B-like protein
MLYAALAFDVVPSVTTLAVSAFRPGVDPATGHDTDLCYASVIFDRESFGKLRLDRLDPIAALRSFRSRFSCPATFALKDVAPLAPSEIAEEPAEETAGGTGGVKTKGPTTLEIAEHVLALAMACGRADGALDPEEVEAISSLIEKRFPLSPAGSERLALRRAALADEGISVEAPARALKTALSPRDRQLLVEQILGVVAADGKVLGVEVSLLKAIGAALDLSPAFLDELLRRWSPAESEPERSRWLAALELPPDAKLDRIVIERASRRMQDLYEESRFAFMAAELREMAARRKELARKAAEELLREFPESPAEPEGTPATVRRENPDLDSIFAS